MVRNKIQSYRHNQGKAVKESDKGVAILLFRAMEMPGIMLICTTVQPQANRVEMGVDNLFCMYCF